MIVADVNLVAYLLLSGPDAALAQRVFQKDPSWAAPLLWRSEFRNVLAAHMRLREMNVLDAQRACSLAESLFRGKEFMVHASGVLTLVERTSCSAYDCEYVALAIELGVPLVTSDKQILKVFPDVSISPRAFIA